MRRICSIIQLPLASVLRNRRGGVETLLFLRRVQMDLFGCLPLITTDGHRGFLAIREST
jgi:hypothetical protein